MTVVKSSLVELIHHGRDPFAFYEATEENVDTQGWRSDHPYLEECIRELLPSKILEVGVWKGASAITLANSLRANNIDGAVLCVDTFRGSSEHWINPKFWKLMNMKSGIPGIYDNFMSNVVSKSLQEFIVPLPVDSATAYEICRKKAIRFDLIHIDAGHEYESVKNDMKIWSSLLNSGGAIIMDDYLWDDVKCVSFGWHGVAKAVNEFIQENSNKVMFKHADGKCVIQYT